MKALTAWSWSASTNALNLAFGLFTGVLVARLLGPNLRGEFAEVQFWSGLIASLGICSLPNALSFNLAREAHEAGAAASACVVVSILAIISVAIGGSFLFVVVDPTLRYLTIGYLAAFVPINFWALTLIAIDHGNQRFLRYNFFRLLPQGTFLASILILWWQSNVNVTTLLVGLWLGTFLVVVARSSVVSGELRGAPRLRTMWMLLRTGFSYHTTALASVLFQSADRLILITFFTHADLGRYAVALTLSGAGVGFVSSATTIVLFPKLAAANGVAMRRHQIRNALGASFIIALLANCVIAVSTPFVLPLVFGPPFAAAVPVAVLLCVAQIPASFAQIAYVALRALGDWRAGAFSQLLALSVFAPVATCLALAMGIEGVAIALIFSQTAAAGLLLQRLRAKVGLGVLECLLPERNWVAQQYQSLKAGAADW